MTKNIIDHTVHYVQQTLAEAEGGHGWWHVQRVWHNARQIAEQEEGNLLIAELGALLHDIADAKFHGGNEEEAPRRAAEFLSRQSVDPAVITAVVHIVRRVSFRKGQVADTPELAIVQDADRLDALGAVGIARAFHYGGFRNQPIHEPGNSKATVQHFYDKLLRLKDGMNTATGQRMADERHRFMEQYLDQFFREIS